MLSFPENELDEPLKKALDEGYCPEMDVAVSYTHLDVYKRQAITRCAAVIQNGKFAKNFASAGENPQKND